MKAFTPTCKPIAAALFFYLVMFTISACNNGTKENAEAEDSVQTANDILTEDSTAIFANAWLSTTLQRPSKQIHLLEFWSEDSLKQKAFKPDSNFYKSYASLLRWSPDSSCIIDIGSYGNMILKDSNGKSFIVGSDPDNEISFIYPAKKNKVQLMFFGPGTLVKDARWLDSSQVAIIGVSNMDSTTKRDTLLWIIDAKQNFFRRYKPL